MADEADAGSDDSARLARELRFYRRITFAFAAAAGLFAAFTYLLFGLDLLWEQLPDVRRIPPLPLACFFGAPLCAVGAVMSDRRGQRCLRGLRHIKPERPESDLSPWFRLLAAEGTESAYLAARALSIVLHRIGETGEPRLTEAEWKALYRRLNRRTVRRETDLALAILGALSHAGSGEAMPVVRRLLADRRLREGHPVREAAVECLGYLEARASGYSPERLVRPAAREEHLLIPAQSAPSDDTLLLRPGG